MSRPPVYPFSGGAGSNATASSTSFSSSSHTGYAPFQSNDSAPQLSNSAFSSTTSLVDRQNQHQRGIPPPRSPVHASLNPSSASVSASSSSLPSSSNLHRRTPSIASYNSGNTHSLSEKFSLSPDPSFWANPGISQIEPDDYLHNPDPKRDHKNDKGGTIFTMRGFANIGCLAFLVVGLTTLFAGYPLITFFTKPAADTFGAFGPGGVNASGQIPALPGNWSVIDKDTPIEAYSKTSFEGVEMELVFSDEFNLDGRSFYPGDDPYWEAADLHYWQTDDLEWYDPSAVTTKNGQLVVTLSNTPEHNLNYTSGMISSWNKFCFTGGRIEVAVTLPGSNNVPGLWPAVWTMGNLGRAGYGASLEGMWPYSYDSCDVGTLPNQTLNGQPHAATINGDPTENGVLSFLQGQRLSACTCKGEPHPGPIKPGGIYTGRSAPEIDVLEAQVNPVTDVGTVSQSCQWAPFDASYIWNNSTQNMQIDNPEITQLNAYRGGVFQQATSGLSLTNESCYELDGGCSTVYGYEYLPDRSKGYISWINNGARAWTIQAAGMGPNELVNISQRIIPEEPMYIIMNLGLSMNFGGVIDFAGIDFPVNMLVDWVRVYQPKGARNIGCDPPDYPTQDYINTYIEAYTDVNLTTWTGDFGQPFPKNSLIDNCST